LTRNITTSTELVLLYEYFDKEGQPESGTIIEWYQNNQLLDFPDGNISVITGETASNNLGPTIVRGAEIYARIISSDGGSAGEPVQTETITIGNSAPIVLNPILSPEKPNLSATLVVTYNYFDQDTDPDQSLVKWFKNGSETVALQNSKEVPASNFAVNDSIYVEITPYDGDLEGKKVTTSVIKITN